MLKLLFFGHLSLGWKRLCRAIVLLYVFFFIAYLNFYLEGLVLIFIEEIIVIYLVLPILFSMLVSYVVSGFVLQKKKD